MTFLGRVTERILKLAARLPVKRRPTSLLRFGSGGRRRTLRRQCRWRGMRLRHGGIDPAGMRPCAQALERLRVDLAVAHEAAERSLDVAAGAAEAVVKLEVAEGGIEVGAPHQVDHAA